MCCSVRACRSPSGCLLYVWLSLFVEPGAPVRLDKSMVPRNEPIDDPNEFFNSCLCPASGHQRMMKMQDIFRPGRHIIEHETGASLAPVFIMTNVIVILIRRAELALFVRLL